MQTASMTHRRHADTFLTHTRRRRRRPGWTGTTGPLSSSAAFPYRSSTTMTSAWCRAFCRTVRGNECGTSGLQSHYLFEDRYVRPGRERPPCRDAESEINWFAVSVRMWLRG